MKKSIISLLVLMAMIINVFALTGCEFDIFGTGDEIEPAKIVENYVIPEGGFNTEEAVEITFYHTMGQNLRDVLDAYIVEFNALYPNITIKHEQVGSYDDVRNQIKTEVNVGNQPNLAYCYPDHVAMYNEANVVVNLNSLIASDLVITRADGTTEKLGFTAEQLADFIPGYYEEGRQFGHVTPEGEDVMYTMPFSKSTEVLYYNKTFFDANGLTVPTTWDELEAVCRQIKAIDPNSIPLGYDSEGNWFITMCEQLGTPYTSANKVNGTNFLFDDPANYEFVKKFNTWYNAGLVTTQELLGAYTSSIFVEQDPTKPNSYMSIGSSAGATHQRPEKVNGEYPFEVGIAPIPQANKDNQKVISQGPSICLFQGKKISDQEVIASWLFLKYLITSVEFQAEFSMVSGYVPVISSVNENEVYADFLANANGGDNIAALSAKQALAQKDNYYASPAFNGSSAARDQVGIILQKGLVVKENIDAELKKIFQSAINECENAQ